MSVLLKVEFVLPQGLRLRTSDGEPFDVARDTLKGDAAPGGLVRIVPDAAGTAAVPYPGEGEASTRDEVMSFLAWVSAGID
jgi:hypothetical protein